LYSAADALVVPSRQEAFGQTASEAHACGTPVVAFNVCGLPDIVEHQKTGYLATPFDTEDLARGIQWVIADRSFQQKLRQQSRAYAVNHFSNASVASKYKAVYENAAKAQI
jgi:glycosyltransferase involved in cell wall biosynthesis